jgi:twitching motility protein PilT
MLTDSEGGWSGLYDGLRGITGARTTRLVCHPATLFYPARTPRGRSHMTQALHTLLDEAARREASDLHLSPGEMPWLRVLGEMEQLELESGALTGDQIRGMLEEVMAPAERERWSAAGTHSVNFAYLAEGIGRFRINLAATLTGTAAVVRRIPQEIPAVESLGLPDALVELADLPAGLVFITGAAGEGKSTSLAALLDRINRTRNGHILTIEDPIEFVHVRKRCRISQREVRIHTESFTRALEDALRQDPDVIVVGEVRSDEQLQLILQAAETGHLVLGTAHTINAVNTITRLVGMVETARQGQVRAQIAEGGGGGGPPPPPRASFRPSMAVEWRPSRS